MKLKIMALCALFPLAFALPVSAQDDLPLAGDWLEIPIESDATDCFGDSASDETVTEDIIITFGATMTVIRW